MIRLLPCKIWFSVILSYSNPAWPRSQRTTYIRNYDIWLPLAFTQGWSSYRHLNYFSRRVVVMFYNKLAHQRILKLNKVIQEIIEAVLVILPDLHSQVHWLLDPSTTRWDLLVCSLMFTTLPTICSTITSRKQ